ncbi:MAG: TIGR03668 family PPOX class F420-dependent oxidoreductase [bacterium]|nr:TIGR03668 family PPOX class F420-dependent oxidoreductase [bacterium]
MRISPDWIHQRLSDARSATLGTTDGAGRAHLVPIVFAYRDRVIYTAIDAKPKTTLRLRRIRNIEANPHVSVLVDHYEDDWDRLWWIRLDGTALIASGGPLRETALELLTEKYPVYAGQPPPGPAIAITVERIRSWSAC